MHTHRRPIESKHPTQLQNCHFATLKKTKQEQPRRFSKQDTLPQLAPLPAVSADLSSTQRRGHTLGPGLDIAFREEPTSIVPTAAADSLAGDEGSGNGHTGVGPIPVDQRRSEGGAGSARHANKGGQGNSDEVRID